MTQQDPDQDREAMTTPQSGSNELSPNDHMVLMLELCKPESMPLVRRWVAALMLAPEAERESIVLAVEKQMVKDFAR